MRVKHVRIIPLLLIFLVLSSLICSGFPVTNTSKTEYEELEDTGEWIQEIGDEDGVYPNGFGVSSNVAPRGMGIYNGELYIGTHNLDASKLRFFPLRILTTSAILIYKVLERLGNIRSLLRLLNIAIPLQGIFCDGCELWKYNSILDEWTPMVSDSPGAMKGAGFGYRRNWATSIIKPFKGKLYVGTAASSLFGCEIWRYDGTDWEQVVEKGFGNSSSSASE